MNSSKIAEKILSFPEVTSSKQKSALKKSSSKGDGAEDTVNVQMDQVYKSLTVTAEEVLRKLEDILGSSLPEGVGSLKPEEHTPEASAERIYQGVIGLLPAFQKQNPELEGEELMKAFMSEVRSGVEQGYSQATGSLSSIGAFEFEGVEDSISKMMELLESKLVDFETNYDKPIEAQEETQQSAQPE
jgi:hypothetical protein